MAAQDAMALVVLHAAARVGLQVPKDLAVLGVDNDELLCETHAMRLFKERFGCTMREFRRKNSSSTRCSSR